MVLAGGLGTRMLPVTERRPKALIPVAGEPFIDHQLRWLASEGVQRVVLAVGYLGQMIQDHVRDGRGFGVDVSYSYDGDVPLGTGGALREAIVRRHLEGPVLVLYGDSYLSVSLDEVVSRFEESPLPALMVVYENQGQGDFNNAALVEGLVRYEKGHADPAAAGLTMIDYGVSVFEASLVVDRVPRGQHADLAQFQSSLSHERLLAGHAAHERFYEIGSPDGLAELDARLGRGPFRTR